MAKVIYGFGPTPSQAREWEGKSNRPQGPLTKEGYFYPKKEAPERKPQGPKTREGYFYPKKERRPQGPLTKSGEFYTKKEFTKQEYLTYIREKKQKAIRERRQISPTAQYSIDDTGRTYFGSYIIRTYYDPLIKQYSEMETQGGSLPRQTTVKKVDDEYTFMTGGIKDPYRWSNKVIASKQAITKAFGSGAGEVYSFGMGALSWISSLAKPSIKYFHQTGPQLYGFGRGLFTEKQMKQASQGLYSVHFPTAMDPVMEPFGLAPKGSTSQLLKHGPSFIAGGISAEVFGAYAINKGLFEPVGAVAKDFIRSGVRNIGTKLYSELPSAWSRAFPKMQPLGRYLYGKPLSHIPVTKVETSIGKAMMGSGNRMFITSSRTTPVMTLTGRMRSLLPSNIKIVYNLPKSFRYRAFELAKTGFKRFTGLERAVGRTSFYSGSFEMRGFGSYNSRDAGLFLRVNQQFKRLWSKSYVSEKDYFKLLKGSSGSWQTQSYYYPSRTIRYPSFIGESADDVFLSRSGLIKTSGISRFKGFLSDTGSGRLGGFPDRVPKNVWSTNKMFMRIKTRFGSEYGGIRQISLGTTLKPETIFPSINKISTNIPRTLGQGYISGLGRAGGFIGGIGIQRLPKMFNISPSSMFRLETKQASLSGFKQFMRLGTGNITSQSFRNAMRTGKTQEFALKTAQTQRYDLFKMPSMRGFAPMSTMKMPKIVIPKDNTGSGRRKDLFSDLGSFDLGWRGRNWLNLF